MREVTELQSYFIRILAELFPKANRFLLAVSGGSDSVALLRLLAGSEYTLSVAHFDHALRKDSSEDASFVSSLCKELSVPYYSTRAEVAKIAKEKSWNLEDTARRLRYSFFTQVAKKISADAIVTAHTLDDQAETVLMQILRGTAFLKGMKVRRGLLLRPLLNIPKQDLLNYLQDLGQDYCTDKTNFDTAYTRSWLRHEIIPKLEARYPNLKKTLANLADLQQAQAEHFDKFTTNKKRLETVQLRKANIAVQRHKIAHLIESTGIASDFRHIEMIRKNLNNKHPTQVSLPKGKLAVVKYGSLSIVDINNYLEATRELKIKQGLSMQALGELDHDLGLEQQVDLNKLTTFPNLKLRYRQAGDRIKLAVGTKKLSDLFIDRKIPRETRDHIPLLASQSEVIWVKGVATDVRVARAYEDNDVKWMRIALEEAKLGSQLNEIPVGAAIVREGELIARATNATEREQDPTAHAEMIVLRMAAKLLKSWRLDGCTLYTTLEPCPMCFGAILQAHLSKLVYGASNDREGALGGVSNLQEFNWKHKVKVYSGVLAGASSKLLHDFFVALRTKT